MRFYSCFGFITAACNQHRGFASHETRWSGVTSAVAPLIGPRERSRASY